MDIQEHNATANQHLPTPDNGEGGEKTLMNISYGKTMMWYFLLSGCIYFLSIFNILCCNTFFTNRGGRVQIQFLNHFPGLGRYKCSFSIL